MWAMEPAPGGMPWESECRFRPLLSEPLMIQVWPEKTALWPRLCAMYPDYASYQARTARDIPVLRLTAA